MSNDTPGSAVSSRPRGCFRRLRSRRSFPIPVLCEDLGSRYVAGSGFGDFEVPRRGVDFVGIGSAAYAAVKGVDDAEFIVAECEVEHVDVLRDPLGVGGLGNYRPHLLEVPPQQTYARILPCTVAIRPIVSSSRTLTMGCVEKGCRSTWLLTR